MIRSSRFLIFSALFFSNACTAHVPPSSEKNELEPLISAENPKDLKEEMRRIEVANNRVFTMVESLLFGNKETITFAAEEVTPRLLIQTIVDGKCINFATAFDLGDVSRFTRDLPIGMRQRNHCASPDFTFPENFLDERRHQFQYSGRLKRKLLVELSFRQYIAKDTYDQIETKAFGDVDRSDFQKLNEGYFGRSKRCDLFLKRQHNGVISSALLIYRYGEKFDLSTISTNSDFLECGYRSRFFLYGLQGAATIDSDLFLTGFKDSSHSISWRGREIIRHQFAYVDPSLPIVLAVYTALIDNGFLGNGRVNRAEFRHALPKLHLKVQEVKTYAARWEGDTYQPYDYFKTIGKLAFPKYIHPKPVEPVKDPVPEAITADY